MDHCYKKCCFGENKCTSFGTNPINIVGTHKVCNFHLTSISDFPFLKCSYCYSICKITLDYVPDNSCSTCQTKNPNSSELFLDCGHFHCESCVRTCEKNKFSSSSSNPSQTAPSPKVNLQSINSTSSTTLTAPHKKTPFNSVPKHSSEALGFQSNSTTKPRPCPNCGDKMQEKSLKCGHQGCLGCYNLKPCIFCSSQDQKKKFPACGNCKKPLKEFQFICGHYGCEGCSFEQQCRACTKLRNKRCEICGGLEEPIPLECQHIGCIRCCQQPCSICFKQAIGTKGFKYNRECQGCSRPEKLFTSQCGHSLCHDCRTKNKCAICSNLKCSNCTNRMASSDYRACKHKLCSDCINRIGKCKLCYISCKCCNKLLKIESFHRDRNYCEGCIQDLMKISPFCELCHYDRISFELRVQGKRICGQCENYALSLYKGVPGSELCQYCGEVSEARLFLCLHGCCFRCFKNKSCFDCIAKKRAVEYEEARNGRALCTNCGYSTKKVVNLLCNHSLCKDCFKTSYLHFDYRCKKCIKQQQQVRCIHCRAFGIWRADKDLLIKSCCFMKVCMTCSELVISPNHKCKDDGLSCGLF